MANNSLEQLLAAVDELQTGRQMQAALEQMAELKRRVKALEVTLFVAKCETDTLKKVRNTPPPGTDLADLEESDQPD